MLPADTIDRERLLTDFLTLVQIDSPSGHEAAIGAYLYQRLVDLSCQVQQDAVGNLIAYLPGQGQECVLLSCHMDTVGSDVGIRPVLREGVVYSDGVTILGADDKSGVAVILEALLVLQKHPAWTHPPLEVVITVGEERGLWGARQVDRAQLVAKWGVVLDAGGPIGTMVTGAPSQDRIEVVVRGKKAHAGAEPEKGINAIAVAAEAIAKMKLGRIDEETTANVGVIAGGEATNIVPDRVIVHLEARSRDVSKLEAQTASMVQAIEGAAQRWGAAADVKVERMYNTYRLAPEDLPYRRAVQALQTLGIAPMPRLGGGGTDGNIYTHAGIPCIVLSTGMAAVHTPAEHIAVQDLFDAARVLVTLLTQDET